MIEILRRHRGKVRLIAHARDAGVRCVDEQGPTGETWLRHLLRLGSRSAGPLASLTPGSLLSGHPRWWGKNERRLNPPIGLLRWLVANASAPSSDSLWGGTASRAKRERLVKGDADTIAEALRLLEAPPASQVWYVLEGQSRPDVFLETSSTVVVIEGKRTERKATTTTTWMPLRSQMLRHMDAAWEMRGTKQVLGLMIVEGDKDATAPNDHWLARADEQVRESTLNASLPHRTVDARAQIAHGFLGATTWQAVCRELGLGWPPGEEAVRIPRT